TFHHEIGKKKIRAWGHRAFWRVNDMAYCPTCGALNEEQATFCLKCGNSLSSPPAPSYTGYAQTPFDRSFKGAGPLLKAFLGFILVLLIVEVVNALSGESSFANRFGNFLNDNLLLIFLILLLAAYSGYSSRRYAKEYSVLSPLIAAIIITFVLWILANIMDLLGSSNDVNELETIATLLFSILYIIFLLVLLIGYIGVIMRADRPQPPQVIPPAASGPIYNDGAQPSQPYYPAKKLGRSSRDKVFAGVCGGMAEYLNLDPFLMRVLWVVGILVSAGTFLVAYLILAIVLPKNP
ncbi:MAG: PspC domain-containing protein, partial [Methanomassiliicoccales archaeon]|nr:PspC domain-containing protein [Methanomassiliicoccales archaeon]